MIDCRRKSYIASVVGFIANILWIAIGVWLLAIARSYSRTGDRATAVIVTGFGIISLAMGMLM